MEGLWALWSNSGHPRAAPSGSELLGAAPSLDEHRVPLSNHEHPQVSPNISEHIRGLESSSKQLRTAPSTSGQLRAMLSISEIRGALNSLKLL